jgi:hypothetical protein
MSTWPVALSRNSHAADTFGPEPRASEVGVAIGKFKRYKSPDVDQIPAELIEVEQDTFLSDIYKTH